MRNYSDFYCGRMDRLFDDVGFKLVCVYKRFARMGIRRVPDLDKFLIG